MTGYDQSTIQAEISGLKVEVKGLSGKVDKIEEALVVLTRLEVEREHQKEANNLLWSAVRELQEKTHDLEGKSSLNTWSRGLWEKFLGLVIAAGVGAVLTWWTTKK
jgi:chromosome segregation ATPase